MDEQTDRYELMGMDVSPYTMKVKSYFLFKGIPFDWVTRSLKTEKRFQEHAAVQLIPMVFLPSGRAMQDSTLIMEVMEENHPEPSMHPDDPALKFLSELLEEFGDEWCNKLMFFQRWFLKADQIASGNRIADNMLEGQWFAPLAKPIMRRSIVRRMIPRLSFAGAGETNIPHLQRSFKNLIKLLNAHLETRSYLFGARPSFGDFGIWGNIYQAWTDPTAGAYIKGQAPAVVKWIEAMLTPTIEGDFESFEALRPTLLPILREEVGGHFLKWSQANAKAWEAGEERTELQLNGAPYEQKTFKYHAHSLGEICNKFEPLKGNQALSALLEEANCLQYLQI